VSRLTLYFFLALVMTGLSACSQPPDCSRVDIFCAGLVTTTEGLNDHAFNQIVWDELQIARAADWVDEIAFIETTASPDYSKNIDVFALDGYDLIITVGMGLRDETLQAADRYPDTFFIGIDQAGGESRANLLVVTFPEDQAGFLAGVLAARMTQRGHVGAVCETSGIESNWKTCEGFRNGVAYIDPKIQTDVRYRSGGSREKLFVDTAWGQETGQKLIDGGADVIFGVGGGTGQGALLAAAEAGIYAIGSERDQFYALPEARPVLLTSIIKQPSPRVQMLIRSVRLGEAKGGVYPGRLWLAPYRNTTITIPVEIQEEMQTILKALESGNLRTNVPVEFPK
jgi:basic membrane protein A